jgi:homocysteine S-methyltransferase
VAVGVNCCAPSDVLPALVTAAEVTDKPLVAYPNSGARWDAWSRRWVGGAAYDVGLAHQWVGAGARYVGGCCRVGVRDIAALTASLSSASP